MDGNSSRRQMRGRITGVAANGIESWGNEPPSPSRKMVWLSAQIFYMKRPLFPAYWSSTFLSHYDYHYDTIMASRVLFKQLHLSQSPRIFLNPRCTSGSIELFSLPLCRTSKSGEWHRFRFIILMTPPTYSHIAIRSPASSLFQKVVLDVASSHVKQL
jgi:hypothetical protein